MSTNQSFTHIVLLVLNTLIGGDTHKYLRRKCFTKCKEIPIFLHNQTKQKAGLLYPAFCFGEMIKGRTKNI